MKFQELISAFLIGIGVVFVTRFAMDLSFVGITIPNIPFIGRWGLVGGLTSMLLIWLMKEKKIKFIPLSI